MDTTKNNSKNQTRIINGLLILTLTSTLFAGFANASSTTKEMEKASIVSEKAVKVRAVAPEITSEPSGETISTGQSATFSVADTGTAPLSYQWRKNGVNISGATSSSYTTPAALSTDNGSRFTVKVSNSRGSVVSGTALLMVDAAPALTSILDASAASLSFGSVTVSTDSVQSATFTNAGTGNVTISSVSVSGAGFNASGISSGTIIAPGQSVALTVTFDPSSSGNATGSVTVGSNATSGANVITLSGTGAAPVTHEAMLNWSPSTSTVTGYNVYVSMVSGSGYTLLASVNTPSYTDGNLQAAQTRYYVVTAVNSDNVESGYSNQATAIIPSL